MKSPIKRLRNKAHQLRCTLLDMCIAAKTGHVTSSLSCVEIMVALHYGNVMRLDPKKPEWPGRDRFILSKGQASPLLYVILADMGFFDANDLDGFAQAGGKFGVHLQHSVPGVETTSGSLGQGFGLAAGLALGARMNREEHLVFTLIGDGECYEGSIWETAMFAAHNNLNNLIAIMDRNYLCVTDFTENLVALEPLDEKWCSFGWEVVRVDGHSLEALLPLLETVRSRRSRKPLMIIADTVKGKGVDSLANVPLWHGSAPAGDLAKKCRDELERIHTDD